MATGGLVIYKHHITLIHSMYVYMGMLRENITVCNGKREVRMLRHAMGKYTVTVLAVSTS